MPSLVINPIAFFPDLQGRPLEKGSVYVGQPNTNPVTNPVTVYQDVGLSIPIQQPLLTMSGMVSVNGSPVPIYIGTSNYSLMVLDKKGRVVLSLPNVTNTTKGGATRPTNPGLYDEWFDPNLGQPIWCSSISPVIWVNAAGVPQ